MLLKVMRKMKMAEQENIRLVEEKSKAELSALKEQISHHFFFNTLSSLSTIVRNDKKEDVLEFIGEMNKTYRCTMASKQDLVSVKEEVDFLQSYLFLIRKRFGEKLILKNDFVSLFYGEGDLKETIKIGVLAGWDSDNPTATWGGMLGFMLGKKEVENTFGRKFSDRFDIHRTRQNFLKGIDNFEIMARRVWQLSTVLFRKK